MTSLHYPRFNKARGEPKRLCYVDDDGGGVGANDEQCKLRTF